MTLRDSREMNYDSKLQNMSWFCYNMWTRCPRQAWPQGSLIIKHYRVQEGEPSTRVSKSLHKSGLALMKELLLLEQINQWLGVLGVHIDWRLQVFKPQNSSHVCMTDLGWFQRKQHWLSRIHGGNLHQMHVNLRKSLLTSEHMLHELAWTNAFKSFQHYLNVQHDSWGETKCYWWAQQQLIGISISLDFHHHVNTVIALVRPKM